MESGRALPPPPGSVFSPCFRDLRFHGDGSHRNRQKIQRQKGLCSALPAQEGKASSWRLQNACPRDSENRANTLGPQRFNPPSTRWM